MEQQTLTQNSLPVTRTTQEYSPAKLHKKQHSFKREQQFMYSSDGAKEGAEDRHRQIEKRMNSVALDNFTNTLHPRMCLNLKMGAQMTRISVLEFCGK
jgi:hypothetical protein